MVGHIQMDAKALHRLRNLLHSAVLIAGMALIVSVSAWALWGAEGLLWSLAGAALAMALSPTIPPSLVLSAYGARLLSRYSAPRLYVALEELSRRAGLPNVPKLYLLPQPNLNAFAVGNQHAAAIAISRDMLQHLNFGELVGVLAHEVSHVANNDLWVMNLADAMSRITTWMSYLGMILLIANLPLIAMGALVVPWPLVLVLLFAPLIINLLQLALSRTREYDADLEAVKLVGEPDGLASALAKLDLWQGRAWEGILFPGRSRSEPSLLRTHPPTEERIRRLMQLKVRPQPCGLPHPAGGTTRPPYRLARFGTPHQRWPDVWHWER